MPDKNEKSWFYRRTVWAQFMRSEYGRIFMLGCLMLIVGISLMGFLAYHNMPVWQDIFTMSIAHMVAGKGVSVVQGLAVGLNPATILILATYSDVMIMLIAYPVLVFTYHHYIESHVFQSHMRPVFDSARRRMDRVKRFKVAGVFFFVWLPLWMTGVLVGSILGYLLGLRSWVSLSAAALGTFTSILCWLIFSARIFATLDWIDDRFVAVLVLALVAVLIWQRRRRRRAAMRNNAP